MARLTQYFSRAYVQANTPLQPAAKCGIWQSRFALPSACALHAVGGVCAGRPTPTQPVLRAALDRSLSSQVQSSLG